MFPRRSPPLPPDAPPSVTPSDTKLLTGLYQIHPNPLKSTLSDLARYAQSDVPQTQGGYHMYFQRFNPAKWQIFSKTPVIGGEAPPLAEPVSEVARPGPPRHSKRCGRNEAGMSFRISKTFHKAEPACSRTGAQVQSSRRPPERSALSCNNPADLSSLVARRLYGGNVAGDVSVTGGCNFQPRRSA